MTKLPRQFDVLVIGAGPAGIAAATVAAECGARVGIVDDNRSIGGQIWRGTSDTPEGRRWAERFSAAGVIALFETRVFHQPRPGVFLAEGNDGDHELHHDRLILATGARERFLPFPGWTLPNVMGAGGLQALVKSGLPTRGKRVVVAGTGPLLLAVASYLKKRGANVLLICEQAPLSSLTQFGLRLIAFRRKLREAFVLRKELSGIRLATSCWVRTAHGTDKLESVTICRGRKTEDISCDYLACGFHLVPNVELAQLLGCRLKDGFVEVDHEQRTSVPDIYCAGEPTGIGGVEQALVQGEIAGLASAGRGRLSDDLVRRRKKTRAFGVLLDRTFALRQELKELSEANTIVCRCEDVTYSRLQGHRSWRAAKLYTRCGMGPCQGRVCGPATEFLYDWRPDSVRPPVFPARVESLSASVESQ